MLDELVVLHFEHRKLGHATIRIEDAELGLLVADERRAVRAALDANAGPRVQLVGYLIDERGSVGHEHDPTGRALTVAVRSEVERPVDPSAMRSAFSALFGGGAIAMGSQ